MFVPCGKMIKTVAAALMVVDHIGYIFFPDMLAWRVVGRMSMPLFAYAIAKGYEHSRQKGTLRIYFGRLLLFSAASQLPFHLMAGGGANIGVTWFFSLLLLTIAGSGMSFPRITLGFLGVLAAAYVLDVDYGVYGVLMPLAMATRKGYARMFLYTVVLWGLYVVMNGAGGMVQVAACASVPALAVLNPQDGRIRIPGRFFYVFYPAHILILVVAGKFF